MGTYERGELWTTSHNDHTGEPVRVIIANPFDDESEIVRGVYVEQGILPDDRLTSDEQVLLDASPFYSLIVYHWLNSPVLKNNLVNKVGVLSQENKDLFLAGLSAYYGEGEIPCSGTADDDDDDHSVYYIEARKMQAYENADQLGAASWARLYEREEAEAEA